MKQFRHTSQNQIDRALQLCP